MKRPSFQFYVGDWQSNSNLRRCTFAEKGIWLDVMCLMHDGEQYGVLRWPLKEIAQAIGCKLSELKSLVTKGVLKGSDAGEKCGAFVYTPRTGGKDGESATLIPEQPGPLWYSSRMVKDEHVSKNRGKGTRFGEQKPPPKPEAESPPTHRIGDGKGDEPSRRIEDGPSIFDLQSSPSGSKKEPMDSAVPTEAAPPDQRLIVIQIFDECLAEVYGNKRAFPAADDLVLAGRFLDAGATADWMKSFFLERMAKRKDSGKGAPNALRWLKDAVPEALKALAVVKGSPNPTIVRPKAAPIVLTPEEQAKYDSEQRDWYLRMGRQHKLYNPEGIKSKEACA
jgi:hypothetical protein